MVTKINVDIDFFEQQKYTPFAYSIQNVNIYLAILLKYLCLLLQNFFHCPYSQT